MITIFSKTFSPRGFVQNQYFSAGQIMILHHQVNFAVGGATFLRNYGGNQTIIEADLPVFELMQAGDPIRILTNTSVNRIIIEKYDDYKVKINANLNLGTNGRDGFVAVNFYAIPVTEFFKRFHYLLCVDNTITYKSVVSNYDKGYRTDEFTTYTSLNTLAYNLSYPELQIFTCHKPIDAIFHDLYFGENKTFTPFAGFQVQTNAIPTLILNIGISLIPLNNYLTKVTGLDSSSNPRKVFFHHNPLIPSASDYDTQNTMKVNSKFRLSRVSGLDISDVIIEDNVVIDQFGYLGERGNGQPPIYTPANIYVNSFSGFLFNTSTQTLKFTIPVQANGTDIIVYVVFQRWVENEDFSGFDLNKDYQDQWGTSVIFAYPLNTTAQIGLADVAIEGQCTSITNIGGNYEYTFEFNVVRLPDIINWEYGIGCYVVIETPTNCESHLLFKKAYSVPIPAPSEPTISSDVIKFYDTEILDVDDLLKTFLTPTYFFFWEITFDVTSMPNVQFKRLDCYIQDGTETFNLVKYSIDLTGHQVDSNGYLVVSKKIGTQGGNTNNHPDMFVSIDSQFGLCKIKFPIIQRIEDWIPLQPNAGVYFQSGQPNNGQNYKFSNYVDANAFISLVYNENGNEYSYDISKNIKFIDEDVAAPYPLNPPASSIHGVYNADLTSTTNYYVGTQYVLKLNNILAYPGEHCISIRAVYLDGDNVFTWGTYYPNNSAFKPQNTYKKIFDYEQPDLYYFTPPRAGKLKFFVIFTRPYSGKDNIITRTILIDVQEPVSVSLAPSKVETQCCELLAVEPIDFSTIIWDTNIPAGLYKNGQLVAALNNNNFGKYYPYNTISELHIYTIDWGKVYSTFGYGDYSVQAGTFESDTYCLVETVPDTIVIDLNLDIKVGNYNFKDNPVRFYYRLSGYIKSDSVSVEREEVKFYNGNIINVKQSNERSYGVTIKKCIYRIYNELANFCIFAKTWKVSDFNANNPIAHKGLNLLPPSAINPEWQYKTNWCFIDFDTKLNKSISSGKC